MTSESEYNIYTSDTGGSKQRKLEQLSAIDPISRHRLAQAAGYGAEKYSRDNYMNGFNYSWCIDALHRHILAFEAGEYLDEESQLPHLAHAAWHCMALMTFVERGLGVDDRFDTIELPKGQEIARQNEELSKADADRQEDIAWSDENSWEDLWDTVCIDITKELPSNMWLHKDGMWLHKDGWPERDGVYDVAPDETTPSDTRVVDLGNKHTVESVKNIPKAKYQLMGTTPAESSDAVSSIKGRKPTWVEYDGRFYVDVTDQVPLFGTDDYLKDDPQVDTGDAHLQTGAIMAKWQSAWLDIEDYIVYLWWSYTSGNLSRQQFLAKLNTIKDQSYDLLELNDLVVSEMDRVRLGGAYINFDFETESNRVRSAIDSCIISSIKNYKLDSGKPSQDLTTTTKVDSEASDQDRLEDLRSESGEPLATDGSRTVTLDVDLDIEAILNEANEVRNKLQDSKPEEEFDFSEWTAEKHQVEHEDWLVASNDAYYSQLAWLESKNKEYAMGALDLASFKYILDERIAWIDELAQENSTMQRGLDLLENRLEEINRDIQREIDKLQEAQTNEWGITNEH